MPTAWKNLLFQKQRSSIKSKEVLLETVNSWIFNLFFIYFATGEVDLFLLECNSIFHAGNLEQLFGSWGGGRGEE